MSRPPAEFFSVYRRRHTILLEFAVLTVVWCAVVAAVVAGGATLLTSVSFWTSYLVCLAGLLVWGVFRWARAVRSYREHLRRHLDGGRPWDDDRPGGGGVREPLPSGGPRSPLRAAVDPEQSTGPSAIP
jgi:hypothetical protein